MVDERPANVIGPPRDLRAAGGVPGRWMAHGIFELEPDEALLVRTWPAGGNYQGIQLLDLWLESLEYANRQTSLTGEQAELGGDGSYLFVVAARDPGVVNWLDTVGRRRGVVLLRYDGTTTTDFDPARVPTATRVAFADLARHLPAGIGRVGPDGRHDALAARRRHVQVRFGN